MNFVTDDVPFSDTSRAFVALPSEFFVDRRLARGAPPIRVDKTLYRQALDKVGSRYAPGFIETHHAFIVPAVSEVDRRVVDSLRTRKLVDDELVADVLAVDFTTPVFSRRRAALIKFFPETASNADALRGSVITALKKAPGQDRAAGELLANLTDAQRTAEAHRRAVQAYLDACNRAVGQLDAVVGWLSIASQRRLELVRAETAQHPEGNIKEEGFRRIFPTDNLTPRTGALRLDPGTCRAVSAQ